MTPDHSAALVRIRGLTKVYATDEIETYAISDISLDIDRGEYVAILGPSGCGKTSLMAILGLLSTPTAGIYCLNGRNVEELNDAQRAQIRNREIGFVFQTFNLIGDLTVYENVELPLIYRGGAGREDRRARVMAVLDRVGMVHRLNHYPSQLSGGQQQRVAVARALVGDPSLLLADEPTGNLDSASGEAVMKLLDELHLGGATICIVTHDTRYAGRAARTVQLFDGQIVDEDINLGGRNQKMPFGR